MKTRGYHQARVTEPKRPRMRGRSIFVWSWLAASVVQTGGCIVTPHQPAANTIPPAVPPNATGTSPAELAKAADPETAFHKKATDRQRFQVHVDFGRIFEAQGNFDAAVLEYQDALTVVESKGRSGLKAADRALAHRRMAGALDRMGHFAQAEVHYKKALKSAPHDPKVWNDLGYSYYLQSRWADAERALRTAAKIAPEDERIRTNLGLTLAAAGRPNDAFPLLSQSAGDAIGHANLGYLLAAAGQLDMARWQYEQALAQRPDLELARRALAQLDRQQQAERNPALPPTRVADVPGATAHPLDPKVARSSLASSSRPLIPPPLPVAGGEPDAPPDSGAAPASAAATPKPLIPPPHSWLQGPPLSAPDK